MLSPCPWAAASVVRNPFGPWLDSKWTRSVEMLCFISDISFVRYNIWLTPMGQLATFLYLRPALKEATGNSAHFFEYKPHLTNLLHCCQPSKEQVHEERVEVVRFMSSTKSADQTFDYIVDQTLRQFFPHVYVLLLCKLSIQADPAKARNTSLWVTRTFTPNQVSPC